MHRLANAAELIDGPLDPITLAGNLRDLARVNRWLGGADLSWRALRPLLSPDRPTTMLDIGTGSADIPRALIRRARSGGQRLDVHATDVRKAIVDVARVQSAGLGGLHVALAGTDRIEHPDRSWDIVHASLLVHHLDEDAARALLAEMGRVARRAVIVNDLERGRAWWLGAWLLTRLATGNRYTRHDAPLSVRRAYRARELRALAEAAGLRFVRGHASRPAYRYALTFSPPDPPHA